MSQKPTSSQAILESFNQAVIKTDIPVMDIGDTVNVHVRIVEGDGPPLHVTDAVFAAVAAAAWRHERFPPEWPVRRSGYGRSS